MNHTCITNTRNLIYGDSLEVSNLNKIKYSFDQLGLMFDGWKADVIRCEPQCQSRQGRPSPPTTSLHCCIGWYSIFHFWYLCWIRFDLSATINLVKSTWWHTCVSIILNISNQPLKNIVSQISSGERDKRSWERDGSLTAPAFDARIPQTVVSLVWYYN